MPKSLLTKQVNNVPCREDLRKLALPFCKPKLTKAMMTKRLRWARKYRTLTDEDWIRVIIDLMKSYFLSML